MHISLDSALGQQRRLNQVGETISSIAAPTAAYSLRSITGGDPKVVRVRRESDNHERDFTASEVSSGALVDFVNSQVTAPLDIRALTATGRDGDFLIAKAAYSLRSLGTRQATVTSSGDTDGDTSGKFVCQVRKDQSSTTDDTKSFTADEVSDGTLVDFILGNTKSLLNSRAYFDGSNDNVKLTSEINMTGDFSLEYSFVVTVSNQQIIGKEIGGSYIRAGGANGIQNFRVQTDGAAETLNLTSNLKYGVANTVKLKRVSGKFGIYDENDVLISAEFTNSDTFTVNSFGRGRGTRAKGVVYNIRIDTNNDGTINHSYNGYGNTLSDWTDLVGSNDATTVNGSPALFTGQDQNGFVRTWYDQSVTNQAGDTATGNHATQSTDDNQPQIVSDGSLVVDSSGVPELEFDGSDDVLSAGTGFASSSKTIFCVNNPDSLSSNGLFAFGSSQTDRFFAQYTSNLIRTEINGAQAGVSAATQKNLTTNLHTTDISVGLNGGSFTTTSASFSGVSASAELKIGQRFGTAFTDNFDGTIQEFIAYNSDQTDNRTAIEANIGEHYSISGIPAFDNSVNGFVETWYDQSGNGNNATQATSGSQPKIVDAGSLLTKGITLDGTNDFLTLTSTLGQTNLGSYFAVVELDSTSSAKTIIDNRDSASDGSVFFHQSGAFQFKFLSTTETVSSTSTSQLIASAFKTSSKTSIGVNGAALEETSSTSTISVSALPNIGARSFTSTANFMDGEIAELIIYNTDESDKREAIEANIADEYGITLS